MKRLLSIALLLFLALALAFALSSCGGSTATDPQSNANISLPGTVPPLGTPLPSLDGVVSDKTLANSWKGVIDGIVEISGATKRYGYFDHDYVIDVEHAAKVHNYDSCSVEGSVSNATFIERSAWLEIGLVSKGTADAALNVWDHPPYMFNQAAFLGCNKRSDGKLQVWPSDYDGQPWTPDPSWIVAPDANGKFNFTFEVKLVPNGRKIAGGLLYLSVNGAPYGTPVTYGQDNWMWFWGNAYHYPVEFYGNLPKYGLPMDQAYVVAQAYTEKSTAYVYAEVQAYITKVDEED